MFRRIRSGRQTSAPPAPIPHYEPTSGHDRHRDRAPFGVAIPTARREVELAVAKCSAALDRLDEETARAHVELDVNEPAISFFVKSVMLFSPLLSQMRIWLALAPPSSHKISLRTLDDNESLTLTGRRISSLY